MNAISRHLKICQNFEAQRQRQNDSYSWMHQIPDKDFRTPDPPSKRWSHLDPISSCRVENAFLRSTFQDRLHSLSKSTRSGRQGGRKSAPSLLWYFIQGSYYVPSITFRSEYSDIYITYILHQKMKSSEDTGKLRQKDLQDSKQFL